eukprot:2725159-Pleurochrysis_carterae.AAC.1
MACKGESRRREEWLSRWSTGAWAGKCVPGWPFSARRSSDAASLIHARSRQVRGLVGWWPAFLLHERLGVLGLAKRQLDLRMAAADRARRMQRDAQTPVPPDVAARCSSTLQSEAGGGGWQVWAGRHS